MRILLFLSLFISSVCSADYWWDISMDSFSRLEVSGEKELWLAVPWGKNGAGVSVSSHTDSVVTGVNQIKLTADNAEVFKSWLSLILVARNTGELITVYGPQPSGGVNTLSASRLMIQKIN